jgi:hypothetical protein
MIRTVLVIAGTAMLTLVALAIILHGGDDDQGYGDSEGGPLVARVLADDRYSAGEPISLVLEVKNTSGNDVTLSYEWEQPYRFWIDYDSSGDQIHTAWESPFTSAKTATVRELNAGEKVVFRVTWDQMDFVSERVVPPGVYHVRGYHLGRCEPQYCLVRAFTSLEIIP